MNIDEKFVGARPSSRPVRKRVWTALRAAVLILVGAAGLAVAAEVALRLWYRRPVVERYFRADAGLPGYALQPSVRFEYLHDGRPVVVTTDAGGRRIVPGAEGNTRPPLFVIGDSQAFGWGLSDGETIAARLQARVRDRWKVVNLAVPGYGPFAYAEMLERIPPDARALVVQSEANDLEDAYSPKPPIMSRCGYLLTRTPRGERVPCLLLSSVLLAEVVKLRMVLDPTLPVPVAYATHAQAAGRVLQYRLDNLYRAAVAGRQAPTYFAWVPWDAAVIGSRLARYRPRQTSARRTVELQDDFSLEAAFRTSAQPDDLFRRIDSHLSTAGADLVAATIARRLLAEGGD